MSIVLRFAVTARADAARTIPNAPASERQLRMQFLAERLKRCRFGSQL